MSAPTLGDAIQIGIQILATSLADKTNKVSAQTGSVVGQGLTEADEVEWWQHYGYASRPPKAEPGKEAAQAIVLRQGGTDAIIASQDLRGLEIYGKLAEGETCIYATGEDGKGQARALFKKDGSVTLFTRKGNEPGAPGIVAQLDAKAGAIRLLNDKGYGLIIDDEGVKLTSGGACLTLAGDSAKLIAKGQTQVDGGGVCIGSMAVPGVNAALTGVTGIAGKASLKVLIE